MATTVVANNGKKWVFKTKSAAEQFVFDNALKLNLNTYKEL